MTVRFIAWHSRPIITIAGERSATEYEEIEVGGNRQVASLAGIAGIKRKRSET
jgi:hypothetical protein